MMVIEVEYIISGVKVKVKDSEAKWQVQMVMSCSHYVVSSTFGLIKVEVTIIHNHKHHLPSSSDAILSLTWMALDGKFTDSWLMEDKNMIIDHYFG